MNNGIDNIILNLKIISKIPENCKVSRNNNGDNQLITLDNKKYTSFFPLINCIKRFLYRDSRERSVNDISNIVDIAINKSNDITNSVLFQGIIKYDIKTLNTSENNFINDRLQSEYTILSESLFNIYTELNACVIGICNLKNKYKGDATITSKIDIILTKINNYTSMIKKRFYS